MFPLLTNEQLLALESILSDEESTYFYNTIVLSNLYLDDEKAIHRLYQDQQFEILNLIHRFYAELRKYEHDMEIFYPVFGIRRN